MSKAIMTSQTLIFITLVLSVAILPRQTSGRCLHYGHSCWGGHGKRSNLVEVAQDGTAVNPQFDMRKLPSDRLYSLLGIRRQNYYPVDDIQRARNVVREPTDLLRKMINMLDNEDENELNISR